MEKGNVVGHSVNRVDAVDKVLGKGIFAADLTMQDMLYAKVLRSAYAHGNIKGINTKKAESLPGVVAVLTAKDVPGKNGYGIIFKDQPVLADDKVRHFGDAVAVVAAETKEIAEKALKLIEVDYEELPAVFSPIEAMEENAPKVHDNNLLLHKKIRKGNMDEALTNSAIVITNEYRTQSVEHCYIEPEAGIAYMDGDTIVVKVATQNPHYDRKDVALNLGLPLNNIRIIQTTTGGGFGGKLDISVQCHLALLTLKTKRPVKMVYDREESFIASAKRHPIVISYTTGADKDGTILAVKVKIVCDTGAYASYGSATMGRAMVHATGPYQVPNVSIDSYCVYTNNPIAGAMRGFGVPQVAFAHECQMDILAEKVGMSSFEIRLKNGLREGSYTATGQQLLSSVGFVETLSQAKGKGLSFLNEKERLSKVKKRGVGVGCMWYGIGNTAMPNPAGAYVDILDDGSVIVQAGCADIGQGSSTILCQIVAEELGVPMDYVRIVSADTGVTPDGGATSASRQTYISGNAARLAAIDAKKHVIEEAAKQLECSIDEMEIKDGKYFVTADPDSIVSFTKAVMACRAKGQLTFGSGWFNPDTTSLDLETGQGKPYATYAFATQVAEVEVDTETGKVEVLKIAAAHDVGRAINPISVIGQIEGGCAMGIGYALLEEVEINKGKIKNPNMSQYLIPTILDMPEVYSMIVEEPESTGPFGAKGVGEPALIPTAAAIANAVYDAIGVRITSLPITPEKVLEALNQKKD